MSRDPVVMAVSRALSDSQRQAIVGRFTGLNPRWLGAETADILDTLCNNDSDLDQTEPFFEANPVIAIIPGACCAARAVIWSGGTLDEASVCDLLSAAGLLAGNES